MKDVARKFCVAVLATAPFASVMQASNTQYLGTTELGDYCGYNLQSPGGPGGIGGGNPIPYGIWAYPDCDLPIGERNCVSSPFSMGWFDPYTLGGSVHFADEACCLGADVRNKYQAKQPDGTPLPLPDIYL